MTPSGPAFPQNSHKEDNIMTGKLYYVYRDNSAPVMHKVYAQNKQDALDSFNVSQKKNLRFSKKASGYNVYNVISIEDYNNYNLSKISQAM